jgi:hypothetical protein
VWWRINEATALMKAFTSDKNPELKNPRACHDKTSVEIK